MQLNPKSIQIAGVATATIVALGFAVASAEKVEPKAQKVAARVTPGPAAIEAEDDPTPKPSATPTPAPAPTSDSSDHDDDGDHNSGDDSPEDRARRWQEAAEERREKAAEAREEWARTWKKASEQRRKENQKRVEKYLKQREHANRQGQNHAWANGWHE
jgi:hypothetical protein